MTGAVNASAKPSVDMELRIFIIEPSLIVLDAGMFRYRLRVKVYMRRAIHVLSHIYEWGSNAMKPKRYIAGF